MYGTEPKNKLINAWVVSGEKDDIVKEHRAIYDLTDDSYSLHERVFLKNHWQVATKPSPISTRVIACVNSTSEVTIQLASEGEVVTGRLKTDFSKDMRIRSISFDYKGAVLKVNFEAMGPYHLRCIMEKHHSEFLYFEWKLFMLISKSLVREEGGERASSRKLIELIKEASES